MLTVPLKEANIKPWQQRSELPVPATSRKLNTEGIHGVNSSLQGPRALLGSDVHTPATPLGALAVCPGGASGNSDSLKTARRRIIAFSTTVTLKMNF